MRASCIPSAVREAILQQPDLQRALDVECACPGVGREARLDTCSEEQLFGH